MPHKVLLTLILLASVFGCVQKTSRKTVVYVVSVKDSSPVNSVAMRGSDKPLSWNNDLQMTPTENTGSYKAVATYLTGYKFTEVKFRVNGENEFAGDANRRIEFSANDTTFYTASFNQR